MLLLICVLMQVGAPGIEETLCDRPHLGLVLNLMSLVIQQSTSLCYLKCNERFSLCLLSHAGCSDTLSSDKGLLLPRLLLVMFMTS